MIAPGATLGLLGGGQLGRMFTVAARTLGYRVTVLDPDPLSPAAEFATGHLNTAYTHPVSLDELAQTCAAVTTEFENAPAEALTALAARTIVRPSGSAVAVAQDREREKGFLAEHGFPLGPYAAIHTEADIAAALARVKLPALLKTARFGYDGKGQATIASGADLERVFVEWKRVPCVLEQRLVLEKELSVILARSASGAVAVFPVAENAHARGILDISIAPARVPEALAAEATALATRLAAALDYVGVLAVEIFVVGGKLFINEIAPRPHNSGHYTIDACRTSQFEQQVRVLCDLPLGDPSLHTPAVMVNLLGDIWRDGEPRWEAVLRHPGAHLHLYGKRDARPGRKMGHVTVCEATLERALEVALAIRKDLGIAESG
ncbi:N5-carboxyaminoimidazole ribonucleotide synthase [Usitatibacter palustris]|uniref:N5-carboxyaminoimidazole ribonucleotide synthase n=1 Tax=Usitatibacter palustris TaxID=2732487 RepID=A0A6M4H9J1_9PROT|nr:5-(carboxyamino)imidazole ribonucleotide synthase [Usitatibacter palustris]QJR15518.1 N5-carboxyaminoimidazole ribonucleotide synthase [Usitatibacter palustris]